MVIRISTATRTAMATALNDQINLGAGAGILEIRTGAQPANPNTAATGTVLATFTLADPAGTVSAGVLTLAGLPRTDASADATGTAGWFRIYDSTSVAVADGTVGTTGTDMIIDTTSIVAGQTVNIVAVSTFTVPVG